MNPITAAVLLPACLLALLASAGNAASLPQGAHYVAMGSSFAAGPGISPPQVPASRCARSGENYPAQLARRLGLTLSDSSCSGATTAHLLAPWDELPAQMDALRPDTALVTITIGGNDVGYIASLFASSCTAQPGAPVCRRSSPPPPLTEDRWQALSQSLGNVAAEVRRRAPAARLVFVDYLTILPPDTPCAQTPMSPADAATALQTAHRLAAITADAARKAGADLVSAASLSTSHGSCADTPWMTGFLPPKDPAPFVPYHPNLAGMTAVATAIEALLNNPRDAQ